MPIAVKTSSRIGRGACKLALSLLDGTWMKAQQDFFFPLPLRGGWWPGVGVEVLGVKREFCIPL